MASSSGPCRIECLLSDAVLKGKLQRCGMVPPTSETGNSGAATQHDNDKSEVTFPALPHPTAGAGAGNCSARACRGLVSTRGCVKEVFLERANRGRTVGIKTSIWNLGNAGSRLRHHDVGFDVLHQSIKNMDKFLSAQGWRSKARLSESENRQPPVALLHAQRIERAGA
jgi:hypothetical protein